MMCGPCLVSIYLIIAKEKDIKTTKQRKGEASKHYDVIVTGGGSGGHVFPGIAVIESLRLRGHHSIAWLGSKTGTERDYVCRSNIPFLSITAGKFHRYLTFGLLVQAIKVIVSFVQAFFVLKRSSPQILVAMGSHVSVPPIWAARILRIPVVVHVCDHSLSLASRLSVKHARSILLSYDSAYQSIQALVGARKTKKPTVITTGYPVRPSILTASNASKKSDMLASFGNAPVLLVLGGSQGSHDINSLVDTFYKKCTIPITIVHQRGAGARITHPLHSRMTDSSQGLVQHIQRDFFFDEYAQLLSIATIVVSRAGAGTLWEIAAYKKPALLIPLSHKGSRGDQLENARYFASIGVAINLGPSPREGEFSAMVYYLLQNNTSNIKQRLGRLNARMASTNIAVEIEKFLI